MTSTGHPIGAREEHFAGARSPRYRRVSDHVKSWLPALILCLVGSGFAYACSINKFLSNDVLKITKSVKIALLLGLTSISNTLISGLSKTRVKQGCVASE